MAPLIIIASVLLAALIAKAAYDNVNDKKKFEEKTELSWGKKPDKEYPPGKLESIRKYYDSVAEEGDVDDITWNDLGMDGIYKLLNHTSSAMGEEMLYALLRKPFYDAGEVRRRNGLISCLENDREARCTLIARLSIIGCDKRRSFFEFFSRVDDIKRESNVKHYLINAVWLAAVAGIFLNVWVSLPIIAVNLAFSIITYYKRKSEIAPYYAIFGYILKMRHAAGKIASLNIGAAEREISALKKYNRELASFSRFSQIVLRVGGGNITDIFFDYVRMLTHADLIKFNNMLGTVVSKRDAILKIHNIIGYLDAMAAAASYRKMKEETGVCVPELEKNDVRLNAEGIYHPLLKEPVLNDIHTERGVLITGSNASGKSTFLKAVAINAILAQSMATANAKKYFAPCFKIMSSMAVSDSVSENKSYFIAEISSLKRILSYGGKIPVLCCIDEVLRGTNTVERIAAGASVLYKIDSSGTLCFAATHDLELANMLKDVYDNYHFQEKIKDGNVIFDYVLYGGPAVTRNAIRLLDKLGYDGDVVCMAEDLADEFEKTGIWRKL